MVQQIRKRRLKSHSDAFSNCEALRQSASHRNRPRSFQNSHSRIADTSRTGKCGGEGIYVEPVIGRRIADVSVADAIGP